MDSPTSSTRSSVLETPPPSLSPTPSSPDRPDHESSGTGSSLSSGSHRPAGTGSRPKVYPAADPTPTQGFSRSARKRQSVQALGSIQFLQHHFTKVGIASSEAASQAKASSPSATDSTIRLAAAPRPKGHQTPPGSSAATSPPPSHFISYLPHLTLGDLPPSPAKPNGLGQQPTFPPKGSDDIRTDPELLRPGVVRELKAVERVFRLGKESEKVEEEVDVLELLRTTISCVRSVRNFVVALPDSAFPSSQKAASSNHLGVPSTSSTLRPQAHQTFSTPSRPSRLQPRISSSSGGPSTSPTRDPVSRIRRSALDLLTSLRLVEEACRLPDETASPVSASFSSGSIRAVTPISRSESPASEGGTAWELGWGSLNYEQAETKIPWEDRLGYLYQGGQTFESEEGVLGRERKVVERYLEVVDEVLFGGGDGEVRGWEKGGSRVSRGGRRKSSLGATATLSDGGGGEASGTEGPEDGQEAWMDEKAITATRLHSLLSHTLPPHLLSYIAASSREDLSPFTNGQLLCHAFNAAVRASKGPWGYVPEYEIHDVLGNGSSSEGGPDGPAKKEYLYRKVENLRLFAAAVKLRYLVMVVPPPAAASTVPLPPQAVVFEPSTVAKQESGWGAMLEGLVRAWIGKVAEEEREARRAEEEGEAD